MIPSKSIKGEPPKVQCLLHLSTGRCRCVPAFSLEVYMQDFAARFYKSKAWQHTRAAYLQKVGGLCERCLKKGLYHPAVIVHHKVYIDSETINNPE